MKKKNQAHRHDQKAEPVVRWILTAILIMGLGMSLYGFHVEQRVASGAMAGGLCTVFKAADCTSVLSSRFAHWFGIPLPVYAFLFYTAMTLILWRGGDLAVRRTLFIIGSGLAGLVSFGLFLVTQKVLHAFCPICYSLYAVNLLLLIVAVGGWTSPWDTIRSAWQSSKGLRSVVQAGLILFIAVVLFGYPKASQGPSPWVKGLPENAGKGTDSGLMSPNVDEIYTKLLQSEKVGITPGTCTRLYGSPDAPLKVWEFSDFQCPYCRQMASFLHTIIRQYGAYLYIEYCYYPLDPKCNPAIPAGGGHDLACRLAATAVCADHDGRFAEVHDAIFQHQPEIRAWLNGSIPGDPGGMIYQKCAADPATIAVVRKSVELGRKYQVEGTPTLFINGMRVPSLPGNILEQIFSRELNRSLTGRT